MGNYCSSLKKDKDNTSEKSEESPSYQLSSKLKKSNDTREAPLADPELTSDASHQNTLPNSSNNGTAGKQDLNVTTEAATAKPQLKALHSVQIESGSNSPLTVQPPFELATPTPLLPSNLQSLSGQPGKNRRTENDRKIVLYILSADDGQKTAQKYPLNALSEHFRDLCACRGFEIHISDAHESSDDIRFLNPECWVNSPLEARGGHHLAVTCLAEISRHSNLTYVIPILFLGASLGSPLLPLTIESQDFIGVLSTVSNSIDKELLQKWYLLDNTAQPPCYRLKTTNIPSFVDTSAELEKLLTVLVDVFSKELQDLYLTTVVEQEINNTVLISQELSKRCIWIQTGCVPVKFPEDSTSLETEMNRRLNNIHTELKNQLLEKNIVRIPQNIQLQADQITSIFDTLISSSIESIIDEHNSKLQIPFCTFGVQRSVLEEIETVNQHSKMLGQNCAYFEIMDTIQSYVKTANSEPLIIFGKPGSGKSVLSAKVAQSIHKWLPDCNFILRYTNLTPASTDLVAIIGSIAEQISYLTKAVPCYKIHDINAYAETIKNCLECTKYQLVILIDSIDDAQNLKNLDWIPCKLHDNVKLILTVTSTATNVDQCNEADFVLQGLKDKISKENFLYLCPFSCDQWKTVLSSGSGDFYATSGALQLPEIWSSSTDKIPLQAKIFWWLAWLGEFHIKDLTLTTTCEKVFETLENKFGNAFTKFIIAIIVASRNGLMETEILKLISESGICKDSPQSVWIQFCWFMGPMLSHTATIKLMDKMLKTVAGQRYINDVQLAHQILYDFYKKQERIIQNKTKKHKSYNKRKFIEEPYHAYRIDAIKYTTSVYLSDISWLYDKLNATTCVHIIDDINLLDTDDRATEHIMLIYRFLSDHMRSLDYDGCQFYSLMPAFLNKQLTNNSDLLNNQIIQQWSEHLQSIPIPYLVGLGKEINVADNIDVNGEQIDENIGYDIITNLSEKGYFVASLSTAREEICVWDVPKGEKVRVLKGIPQPTALCPAGEYGAAVLCRREIKVIDLNDGVFKVTLKGVMNQKMPYFGLHDSQHLVCLSRNRMYVNLMNLETGDCVTTFKAGEDRFLNSLLVSGDGRILVCGDETQKPFPLLVWHLTQRKLLYDLRIPHHDFITSLSAITHEGSYVSVVAKELNEPAPNFIVVYDLQSGTLFKKWKPNYNTVSLAISQTNTCVIAGLEDARIFIWDLVTGNCKYTLIGHCAPVTWLKLDPDGKVLLSGDKDGRDMSVRMWELVTGIPLAVHTPLSKITTCEILAEGRYIVLALENYLNLVTLELKNSTIYKQLTDDCMHYGSQEKEGKTFILQ